MKLVVAIIRPTKLQAVQEALANIGVERMTACDAQGFATRSGQSEVYRGVESPPQLQQKVALEIVVNEDFLDRTMEVIASAARTGPGGRNGDGKIFVLPCHDAVAISSEIRGPEAV